MYNFDEQIDRRNTNSFKWDIKERHINTGGVLGMWTADMDFRSPQPMLDAMEARLKHGVIGYTIRSDNYKDIIRGWTQKRYGWSPDDEAIHVCPPGVIPAVCMLIDVLTAPGDSIFAFMPNYDSLYGAAESMGRKLVTAPLKGGEGIWRLNLKEFERLVKEKGIKLALFCSPHNPVGRVWTEEELEDFGAICRELGVFVISDEVHCDILRAGVKHTPMACVPGMEELSAVLMSPNKTFNVAGVMTASVFINNREVMEAYKKKLSSWAMTLDTTFGTIAVETLYSDPDCEIWLDECREYLSANLEYAAKYINERVPLVSTYVPEGTYLLWLDFSRSDLRGEKLRRFLVQECRLDLCDGWEFDPECLDHMRLNCACTRATLKEAMLRLEEGMLKHSSARPKE